MLYIYFKNYICAIKQIEVLLYEQKNIELEDKMYLLTLKDILYLKILKYANQIKYSNQTIIKILLKIYSKKNLEEILYNIDNNKILDNIPKPESDTFVNDELFYNIVNYLNKKNLNDENNINKLTINSKDVL